jgi:hypothetical protein
MGEKGMRGKEEDGGFRRSEVEYTNEGENQNQIDVAAKIPKKKKKRSRRGEVEYTNEGEGETQNEVVAKIAKNNNWLEKINNK